MSPFASTGIYRAAAIDRSGGAPTASTGLTPDLSGDLGLVLIIGGTNARWALVDGLKSAPLFGQMSWQAISEHPQFAGREIDGAADEVVDFIAGQVRTFLEQHGVFPSQIKDAGLSIAGLVGTGPEGATISTVNTPVKLKTYPFAHRFVEAFNESAHSSDGRLGAEEMAVVNDGYAATLGEYLLPDGDLHGVQNGIFVIVGTGIGGGGITNGVPDPRITELGHLLIREKDTGQFAMTSLAALEAQGNFRDGVYLSSPTHATYAETILAGPWVAVRFVKELGDDEAKYELLVKEINRRFGSAHAPVISADDVARIGALDVRQRQYWAMEIPGSVLKVLNKFIFSISANDYFRGQVDPYTGRAVIENPLMAQLLQKGFNYKLKTLRAMGAAVGALANAYPGYKIVLGGGFAEAIGSVKGYGFNLEVLRGSADLNEDQLVISKSFAERREAAFVAAKVEERARRSTVDDTTSLFGDA